MREALCFSSVLTHIRTSGATAAFYSPFLFFFLFLYFKFTNFLLILRNEEEKGEILEIKKCWKGEGWKVQENESPAELL